MIIASLFCYIILIYAKFYGEGKNINRCVATMEPWEEPEKVQKDIEE